MDNLPDISIHLQSLVQMAQAHGEPLPDPVKGPANSEQILQEMSQLLQDMKAASDNIEARRFDLYRSGIEKGIYAAIGLFMVLMLLRSLLNRIRMNRWLYGASVAAILVVFVFAFINMPDWIVALMKEGFDPIGRILGQNG